MSDKIECTSCGAICKAGARLCVTCGTNLVTGETLATETEVEVVEPDATWRGVAGALLVQLLPGLFRPVVLLVSGLGLLVASVVGGFGVWAMYESEITGAAAMTGLALAINAQAMAWIVTGDFQTLIDAMAEMGGRIGYYAVLVFITLGAASWLVWLVLPVG